MAGVEGDGEVGAAARVQLNHNPATNFYDRCWPWQIDEHPGEADMTTLHLVDRERPLLAELAQVVARGNYRAGTESAYGSGREGDSRRIRVIGGPG